MRPRFKIYFLRKYVSLSEYLQGIEMTEKRERAIVATLSTMLGMLIICISALVIDFLMHNLS